MPMEVNADLDQLCINTIRTLAMDAVQKADSGHPGMPMGAAAMAYVLWTRFLRHNPADPSWPNRDRYVQSAGHGCMLLYSLLHLTGYDLPMEELKNFRQWGSRTPGHPEYGLTPGVETSTGPLGQGVGNSVGMAMAARHQAAVFNRPGFAVVNHFIYTIASDGDLMEGVASEAASLAGHLRLGNLILLYDDNHISIEGNTALAFSEDVGLRFEAYGWHVQRIDGNDLEQVDQAIRSAQQDDRPSMICARTHIGFGSPNKVDTAEAHGSPLGEEETRLTKRNLGWPEDKHFYVPEEAQAHFREALEHGKKQQAEWKSLFRKYSEKHPEQARQWNEWRKGRLPEGWQKLLPVFKKEDGDMATRQASGKVINVLAPVVTNLIGGSADLAPSTNTLMKCSGDFEAGQYHNRNLRFGVREHAMGSVLNGMTLYGGLISYGATFLIFSDYMRPTIRLAALMEIRPIYVFTHDSVGLGEDGPTHQPIEHLPALRAIPHLLLIRPADPNETAHAWRVALEHRGGPVAIALTRQKVPTLDPSQYGDAAQVEKGAYVLSEADGGKPRAILIASGSEVGVVLGAKKLLEADGIPTRVVSMPCWALFEKQTRKYRNQVLPPSVKARVAVEAAATLGWERWVGNRGDVVGLDRFGASAPAKDVMSHLGFTPEHVAERARKLVKK
ncbi:MAG: transketolase [Acidobacteriota bacterium]